jgi:DNA-binding CsgD family transcriptional regulator
VREANDPALAMLARRDGHPVLLAEHVTIDSAHRPLAELVLSGTVDSFEAKVSSPRAGTTPVEFGVWVRALAHPGEARRLALAAVVEGGGAVATIRLPGRVTPMAAGAVDEEWTCEWVTADVTTLLGYRPADLVGTPLLALAHPTIAGDLVVALTHAVEGRGGSVLHARLRGRDDEWRTVQMALSPRPDDRAGVIFLLLPEDHGRRHDLADVDRQVERATRDRHVMLLARDGAWPQGTHPGLSSRQWEIVTRLQRGERVPGIAAALFLSQSTVRNHLTAVFRKFGVHSQAELLATLRGDELGVPV